MDIDEPDRNNPSVADGHAILADRVFDGHGWHAEAAVLIRDGRIVGLGSLERGSLRLAADAPPGRRLPRPRLHRSAGQRRRRRSPQRSTDGRRHARHCPGAPPLWHHGVPANPDHRYARTDADRHRGGSLDRRAGTGSSACIWKAPSSVRGVRGSTGPIGSRSLMRATWRNCANSPAPAGRWLRWRPNAFRRVLSGRWPPRACGFRSGTARRPLPLSCRPSRTAQPA